MNKQLHTETILKRIDRLRETVVTFQEKPDNSSVPIRHAWRELCEMFTGKPTKKVMVVKDKHEDSYYDASTKELRWRAMYDVVRLRNELGYWYSHYENIPEYPEPPKTPLEFAEGQDEAVARAIRGVWGQYERDKKEIDNLHKGKRALEKALESKGNDESARFFLDFYDHCEYFIINLCEVQEEASIPSVRFRIRMGEEGQFVNPHYYTGFGGQSGRAKMDPTPNYSTETFKSWANRETAEKHLQKIKDAGGTNWAIEEYEVNESEESAK